MPLWREGGKEDMLFNSYIFIFLFLPLCLAGYYVLIRFHKGVAARIWLTAFSWWFYGYFNPGYLMIMLCSILFNYAVFCGLGKLGESGAAGALRWRKALFWFGIGCNLAVLFYFKYYDFFIENINAVFRQSLPLKGILLPLGISFFTFQQIGFLADAYMGELKRCSFSNYALFVSFFPQLIAGPIVNHQEMMPQFSRIGRKRADGEKIASGVFLFTLGMVKKVLVADTFGKAVDWGYLNIPSLSGVDAALVIVYYALQLYFDFSGYCDMARGLGWMLGLDIPVNFRSPYKASNIIEFWRRWHITLSRFFRKYVYIPLGGNRKGRAKMYCNMFLVFFLSGFWHGAGWTFIIWGLAQGVLYLITRAWQLHREGRGEARPEEGRAKGKTRFISACGTAFTFLFYCGACVFFRSDTVPQALEMFGRLAKGGAALPSQGITQSFNLDEFWYVIKLLRADRLPGSQTYLCALITAGTLLAVFAAPNTDEMTARFRPAPWTAVLTAVLLLWCVFSMAGVSSFLYFNF